jgi:glycosyltransferase involved in cell wall biosynthesis
MHIISQDKKKIFFFWNDAPYYARAQIQYIVLKNKNLDIRLYSNFKNKKFKHEFNLPKLIDEKLKLIKTKNPNLIFIGGWTNEFIKIARIAKKNSSKVVLMMDNSKKKNLRQFFGKIYFNFFYKKNINYYWVPGKSSKKLLNYFGISNKFIFTNLYNVNEKIFYNFNFKNRNNNIVYVGQLIIRKNINLLVNVFKKINLKLKKTKLIFITNTKQNNFNLKNKNIIVKKNLSPTQIAKVLNKVKYFVMLSKEDHWPLAVLEAACCGCFLFLSNKVGNCTDFTNNNNSLIFDSFNENLIADKIINKIDSCLGNKISTESTAILKKYNLKKFNLIFNQIIKKSL